MPARFGKIIHQQAQVSSFETHYSNPESQTLCCCQNTLNNSRHLHGFQQTVAGKCSRYPTL